MATQGLTDTTTARGMPLGTNARVPLGIVLVCGLAASVLPLSSDGPLFLLAVAAGTLTAWLIWRLVLRGERSTEGLGRTSRALGKAAIVLALLGLALAVVRWIWAAYYAPPPMSIAIGVPGAAEAAALRSHHQAIMTDLTWAQLALFGAGLALSVSAMASRFHPRPR